jgi:hypothetical protein
MRGEEFGLGLIIDEEIEPMGGVFSDLRAYWVCSEVHRPIMMT